MTTSSNDLQLCLRLLRQARRYWPHIAGIFALSLLATPLALLTPIPIKIVVDSVIGSKPMPGFLLAVAPASVSGAPTATLVFAVVLLLVIALLVHLQSLASWLLQTYAGEKMVLEFRALLLRHAHRLSLAYHDSKGVTDSIYRIQLDARSIQYVAINGVIPFVTASFTLLGMIYVIAILDWQLALVTLAVTPVLYLLTQACRNRLSDRWDEVKDVESSAMSVLQETLSSIRVVKAFGQEDRERERFVSHSSKGVWGQLQLAFIEGSFDLLFGLTIAIGTGAALLIGVLHVRSGVLTLGELLIVMAYLAQLYGPLETISKKATQLQSAFASARRAFSLLDEAPDVIERPNARPIARSHGNVAFRNVSFSYLPDRPALNNISFAVEPGTRVGIAGRTGAGKTTLLSLLTRLYDPTEGEILLDGVDLRDYKLADLRNQFTIVLQEPVLFSTTIAENIAYARPDASQEEIVAAAKAANAHEFIAALAQGYDTEVGERGMSLSGGERQRISLARAFLKDAPILLLDEPTSSVDTKTEAVIMEAMERLISGRTTFMIAHRMSTLEHCDMRLEFDSGRVVSSRATSPTSDNPSTTGAEPVTTRGEYGG